MWLKSDPEFFGLLKSYLIVLAKNWEISCLQENYTKFGMPKLKC